MMPNVCICISKCSEALKRFIICLFNMSIQFQKLVLQ